MRGRLLILLLRLLSLLPLRTAHALGSGFGMLLYYLPNKIRRVTQTNLGLCFPELSEQERDALLKDTLKESGKTITEIGAMWFWPREKVLGLVKEVQGEDVFRKLQSQGKGVIALTPHLGQWELMGLFGPTLMPMSALYRPMRMQELETPITQARSRTGNRLRPTTSKGVKEIYAALRRGEMVGILPDQDPGGDGGLFTPFFGIDTYTMVFVSRLAIRTGVGVLVTYAERLPKGRGYRLVAHRLDPAINAKPLEQSVATMNAAVEQCVRAAPAQYQWIYKRFKRRPEGEADLYSHV